MQATIACTGCLKDGPKVLEQKRWFGQTIKNLQLPAIVCLIIKHGVHSQMP